MSTNRMACPTPFASPRKAIAALAVSVLIAVSAAGPAASQTQARSVPDTFTAITTNMTPAGLTLKIDVRRWSADDDRAAVIAALTGESDTAPKLAELPTLGYIWVSGSAVGTALKYAHRAMAADGGERITFVTDQRLDAYHFKPWSAVDASATNALDYSVVELYLSGARAGTGTMSFAADVTFDGDAHTVSLSGGQAGGVLSNVRQEPKPYWAQGG